MASETGVTGFGTGAAAYASKVDRLREAYEVIVSETVELHDGVEETPGRAARAWLELTSGYDVDIEGLFKTFDAEGYDEMIAVRDVPFDSLCEHHLLGFSGVANVVYLPTSKIVGLSKIPRVVQAYAKRLQNQERLTANIADALVANLDPLGVLVVCEAEHSCMRCRGVRSGGTMVTSITRGVMRDKPASRDEALRLIGR